MDDTSLKTKKQREWDYKNVKVQYSNPRIQALNSYTLINSMDDVMYFYYDVEVFKNDEEILSGSAADFPKVQNLNLYIDEIVNRKEEDMFEYENVKDNGFLRRTLYSFIKLKDSFEFDEEYSYKIEKEIIYVKQQDEIEAKRYERYYLTIMNCKGDACGKAAIMQYLSKEDLLRLKKVALEFCKLAIDEYNKELKEYLIKCPNCNKNILLLKSFINEDENHNNYFKCPSCNQKFNDNDNNIWIDE